MTFSKVFFRMPISSLLFSLLAGNNQLPQGFLDIISSLVTCSAFFILYAEIHYRFKFTPSRLFQRQPEIIADAPHRLPPNTPVPILIFLKDAHLFPCELVEINTEAQLAKQFQPKGGCASSSKLTFQLLKSREAVNKPWWWRILYVKLPDDWLGWAQINVVIDYRVGRKTYRCCNDNYIGVSHAPLHVFLSDASLPSVPNYYYGDLHCHTNATSDQVEFGAPLEAMVALAQAQELSFFAATDHSYDLDDYPEDYLHNDPALRKWHDLQVAIRRLNDTHANFVILSGEEVSCGNARGRNVHFLILNHPHFIRGSGDSAERWLRTKPDHTIAEVLAMLTPQALAFAAHPAVLTPYLESLLLGRGHWDLMDLQHDRLNGVQFWNAGRRYEEEGLQQWRALLLQGRRMLAIAGSDAHGNFNRFRQITLPFMKMIEHHRHLFGSMRTAAYVDGKLQLDSLIAALHAGRACLTNGPLIDFSIVTPKGGLARMGDQLKTTGGMIMLNAVSSAEFGKLAYIKIWRGDLERKEETTLYEETTFPHAFQHRVQLPLPSDSNHYYLRAEAITQRESFTVEQGASCRALTNPIWIEKQS